MERLLAEDFPECVSKGFVAFAWHIPYRLTVFRAVEAHLDAKVCKYAIKPHLTLRWFKGIGKTADKVAHPDFLAIVDLYWV